MRSLLLCLFALATTIWLQSGEIPTSAFKVMTFNLRFASDEPPNSWPERRPVMQECLKLTQPDIIGTQEGVYRQIKDLAHDLPVYDWIGLGRDGGSKGEFMAVFYKKERFEPLAFDHFWLSDTPDLIASTTWGNSNRRMVTWVQFRDRATKKEFYFLNTHLDHQIQEARIKSAHLINKKISEFPPALPLILLGDFNASAGKNEVYDLLLKEQQLVDSWSAATMRHGEMVHTFHGYRGIKKGDDRIDWILFRGPFTVHSTEIVTFSKNAQFPSDHFPVIAELELK
ncbi:MAG: endonuclease/exonuclease/phosphatase family protein [Verrucomicrobiota bacterium]|nr:endonuclease/exonuclease/phosphatase family protein [Verrucomicrobiota bacterium]